MRKNLNKKGFTLVELLAVIVILAVIMVIATQQVNKAIKKSRGNTFYETVQSVRKSAQTVCAMDNKISTTTLTQNVDFSAEDVTISVSSSAITVTVVAGGKYANNTGPSIDKNIYTASCGSNCTYESGTTSVTSISFAPECPVN